MKRSGEIKVAAIQMSCDTIGKEEKIARALRLIRKAAKKHVDILLLPELFTIPYARFMKKSVELFGDAETVPGQTIDEISEAAKLHGIFIIAPLFEIDKLGVYYDIAVVIGPDGDVLAKYYKTQIPCRHGSEKFYFRPGPLQPAIPTSLCNIGVAVCYDAFFPEVCRLLTLSGSSIIFVPAAAMWDKEKWKTILRTRALENGVYLVAANRAGEEEGLSCFGTSLVVDPEGNIIAEGNETEEQIVIANANLEKVERTRIEWAFLRDLNPNVFRDLSRYID
jgi:predicted amidohydrolase